MGLRDKARESSSRPDAPPTKTPSEAQPPQPPVELEAPKPSPESSPTLEPSVTYLVEEERPDIAYSLFVSAQRQGMRGVVVSRTYPKNLRKSLDLRDVPLYWLTNAMSDEAIGPKDLERLSLTIRRFLDEGGGQLVLIDSLEYIITNNKFVSVLRLLQTIRDMICTPCVEAGIKEARMGLGNANSQAISSSRANMDGAELAALYTLQDGLPRDAE